MVCAERAAVYRHQEFRVGLFFGDFRDGEAVHPGVFRPCDRHLRLVAVMFGRHHLRDLVRLGRFAQSKLAAYGHAVRGRSRDVGRGDARRKVTRLYAVGEAKRIQFLLHFHHTPQAEGSVVECPWA